jgi:multidrug transporter EmrE-like cation transporter
MNFLFEPAFWVLLVASLSAWANAALTRSVGRIRGAALFAVWAGASGTTYLLFGILPAVISAACSSLVGIILIVASIVWSGVKSMPKRRFEER